MTLSKGVLMATIWKVHNVHHRGAVKSNRKLTIGAPRWPMSFGFSGKCSSIRQGDQMNRGHRKIATDTTKNTAVMRNFDPVKSNSKISLVIYLHCCVSTDNLHRVLLGVWVNNQYYLNCERNFRSDYQIFVSFFLLQGLTNEHFCT